MVKKFDSDLAAFFHTWRMINSHSWYHRNIIELYRRTTDEVPLIVRSQLIASSGRRASAAQWPGSLSSKCSRHEFELSSRYLPLWPGAGRFPRNPRIIVKFPWPCPIFSSHHNAENNQINWLQLVQLFCSWSLVHVQCNHPITYENFLVENKNAMKLWMICGTWHMLYQRIFKGVL